MGAFLFQQRMYFALKNTENKSLIREGFPIDASVKVSESNSDAVEEILLNTHSAVGDMDAGCHAIG